MTRDIFFIYIVQVSHNIPTCESLPPSSDDASCVQIDEYRNGKEKDKRILQASSHF